MKELLDEFSIRSTIAFHIGHHHGSFLLLEGEKDSKFYGRFFNKDCCLIIPCGFKKTIIAVSKMAIRTTSPIFGIVDSDFDLILHSDNGGYDQDKIFLTDTHDLETLSLKTLALDNLLIELADPILLKDYEKRFGITVRETLIKSSLYLGIFRYYNEIKGKNFNFDQLDFINFIDKKTLECDINRMIETVKKNSRDRFTDFSEITKFISDVEKTGIDPWIMCNGHDMSEILFIGLKYIFGTSFVKFDYRGFSNRIENVAELESHIRMNYDCMYFRETLLYSRLKKCEYANSKCQVLKC